MKILILLLTLLLLTGCGQNNSQTASSPTWSNINDFCYQLQNINLTEIGASKFDLVVIDYSQDGTEATRFTTAEISALKNSSGGEKLVLAYFSIGEAEDYRWYWESSWNTTPPSWLGPVNPNWAENYKVRYWESAWQDIVFSYLDKIIDNGYDGVYLDIIDAYQYWNTSSSEAEMVDFVKNIASYARVTKGKSDFAVFPNNGEALSSYADYVQAVTGIGKESLWYSDNTPQSDSATTSAISKLDTFKNAGKTILVLEYPTQASLIDDLYSKANAKGYIPYATISSLDTLTINSGHEPD